MTECAWIPGVVIASSTGVGLAVAGMLVGALITVGSYVVTKLVTWG